VPNCSALPEMDERCAPGKPEAHWGEIGGKLATGANDRVNLVCITFGMPLTMLVKSGICRRRGSLSLLNSDLGSDSKAVKV